MRKVTLLLVLLLGLAFGAIWFSGASNQENSAGLKVRFQLQWFHQAQFAGVYIAKAKGFFAEEGLNVQILQGGYAVRPVQSITNAADVALATADQVVLGLADGTDMKVLGSIFDKSIVCFMSKEDAGIRKPSDFGGKTVAYYPGFDTETILKVLLFKNGIDPQASNIAMRPAGMIEDFKQGGVDVWPSYRINEPIMLADEGIKVDCLKPEEFGVQFYSDTVIANSKFLADHPDVNTKLMRALRKGWQFAREDPAGAFAAMYSMGLDLPKGSAAERLQFLMLSEALKNLDPSTAKLLTIDKEIAKSMVNDMASVGLVPADKAGEVLAKYVENAVND